MLIHIFLRIGQYLLLLCSYLSDSDNHQSDVFISAASIYWPLNGSKGHKNLKVLNDLKQSKLDVSLRLMQQHICIYKMKIPQKWLEHIYYKLCIYYTADIYTYIFFFYARRTMTLSVLEQLLAACCIRNEEHIPIHMPHIYICECVWASLSE